MRSMPILLKLTETTTPNKNITIGTNSSIGITYPLNTRLIKKGIKQHTHPFLPLLGLKSIGILLFMQLVVYGLLHTGRMNLPEAI